MSDHSRSYGTGDDRPSYSRSWEKSSYPSRNMASFPGSRYMSQNAFMYSQVNMQNTLAGLTNVISN